MQNHRYCHNVGVAIDGVWTGYGFSDHLNPQLATTSNYSPTANLHTLQITAAAAKPSPACYVLTSRSLATASNSGDSSASRAQVLLSQSPMQNSLSTVNYNVISSQPPLQSSAELPTLSSLHFAQLAWDPRYIDSGRTQQKTPLSTVLLLLLRAVA
jgi:hypothetical protein